jgi:hypothetical protein
LQTQQTSGFQQTYQGRSLWVIIDFKVIRLKVSVLISLKKEKTYVIFTSFGPNQIERNGRHQIDEEPASNIMNRYSCWIRNNFIVIVDKCGAEIDENVNDEHDIDGDVYVKEGVG